MRISRRRSVAAVLLSAATALSGCQTFGLSGLDDELERSRREKGFFLVTADPKRTVILARGREVVVAPQNGTCVAPDSVDLSLRAAFVLLSDCVVEDSAAVTTEDEAAAEALPQAFPGVMTVSISGAALDAEGQGADAALAELQEFLATPEGLTQLGRAPGSSDVEIKEMRVIGPALYVLVNDRDEEALPIFAPHFWRAFVDLNERMTLATISSFRDRPVGEVEMLAKLVEQVSALTAANRLGSDPPTESEAAAIAEIEAEQELAVEMLPTELAPASAPRAPRRRSGGV